MDMTVWLYCYLHCRDAAVSEFKHEQAELQELIQDLQTDCEVVTKYR